MPEEVNVGYKLSVVEVRSLPLSIAGQHVFIQFISKSSKQTQPSLVDAKGMTKFAY